MAPGNKKKNNKAKNNEGPQPLPPPPSSNSTSEESKVPTAVAPDAPEKEEKSNAQKTGNENEILKENGGEGAPTADAKVQESPGITTEAQSDEVPQTENEITEKMLTMFNLDSKFSTEDKLCAVCVILSKTIRENQKLNEEVRIVHSQLGKQEETKSALTKLIEALRTQVTLTKEEGEIRIMEETQKRIDVSNKFQGTMSELSGLLNNHTDSNTKLKDENAALATQMTELIKQYEARETKIQNFRTEFDLHVKLYEAKLAKANIEKAELNSDFTRERLEMHKQMLEMQKDNDDLMASNRKIQEHLTKYQEQYDELSKGFGDKSDNYSKFRDEMGNLGKKLRTVESDVIEWKSKYESSHEQVRKMNAASLDRERELGNVKKKLQAMEKLNRTLQQERKDLQSKLGDM